MTLQLCVFMHLLSVNLTGENLHVIELMYYHKHLASWDSRFSSTVLGQGSKFPSTVLGWDSEFLKPVLGQDSGFPNTPY